MGEGWGDVPREGTAGAGAGHQCHQEPSVSSAQPAGLQQPLRVPEEGDGEPFPSTPGAVGTRWERLRRPPALSFPRLSALTFPGASRLSCRLLDALGAPAPFPAPLPSAHPAPPHMDTPPGVRGELGHNQDTGITAQGQAVGGGQSSL